MCTEENYKYPMLSVWEGKHKYECRRQKHLKLTSIMSAWEDFFFWSSNFMSKRNCLVCNHIWVKSVHVLFCLFSPSLSFSFFLWIGMLLLMYFIKYSFENLCVQKEKWESMSRNGRKFYFTVFKVLALIVTHVKFLDASAVDTWAARF